jgi:hypothetical protein
LQAQAISQSQQGNAASVPVPSTADSPEVLDPDLRPIRGELVDKLDSKTAKSGTILIVKTTATASTANGVVIPKGSKLVGRVTDIQPHENGNDNAKVTLQFDHAELKGGQSLPIRSVIEAIAPPNESTVDDAVVFGTMIGGAPSSDSGPPGTGTANTRSVPAPVSGLPSGTTLKIGTVISQNGNVTVRTTAIPGVLLASNSDGQPFPDASGSLLSSTDNVHLDGGTHIVLAVSDVTAAAKR